MEVTDAHAQQALLSSLMEKPVIMVRFKQEGGGGGGADGRAVLSICRTLGSYRYTKKVRAGRYWSIAPPPESKKIP